MISLVCISFVYRLYTVYVYAILGYYKHLNIIHNMSTQIDKIYTVKTACDYLDVKPNTLRKELRKGNLKGHKKLNQWYMLHSDLIEFVKSK